MNLFSVRTLMVGLLTMMIGVTFTGCGIPVNLSEPVDLIKDVEIPARPEAPDDIREIPEEFYQYVENWEEF